jgi:hypothetical protein
LEPNSAIEHSVIHTQLQYERKHRGNQSGIRTNLEKDIGHIRGVGIRVSEYGNLAGNRWVELTHGASVG